jgi:hypothetical protein
LKFSVVVWGNGSQKVSVTHAEFTVIIFERREDFENLVGWTEEPDFVFICSSNSALGRT